jgi:transcriptional regulator with GAF, ATPase, and Fis domain
MVREDETLESTGDRSRRTNAGRPGLAAVFASRSSLYLPLAFDQGTLVLRRGSPPEGLPDDRLSREHAEVRFSRETGWTIRDLGSRNGTFVDGRPVRDTVSVPTLRVLRIGDTVLVPCPDVDSARPPGIDASGAVVGSGLREAFASVKLAASTSRTVVVRGETGTGKELAARRFHAAGPHGSGPFIAVNCAAIPEGLAERLLFGAKRGAFSGATSDVGGYTQASDGGVLFLDEGAELDLAVQSKLLRLLETGEVIPLGESRGQRVDLRVCVATHRDLRAAVVAGHFRADLYHRIAPPEIVLPPLRERLDEIAEHVTAEIRAAEAVLTAHARLVEACLLRPWPGNVRELRKEIQQAAARASAAGSDRVRLEHLSEQAGRAFEPPPAEEAIAASTPASSRSGRRYVRWSQSITREELERALAEHGGSVARAARTLGMQRSQMYREMTRCSIKRPRRR